MIKRIVLTATILTALSIFAIHADNSPKKNTVYLVSDSHLDTQWNWDVRTTIKEYLWNTVNQNLELLRKYPDYIFNFEGGVKYSWMKEYYPREFELVKKYVNEGRWHISGASWDANDVIVPSPESIIRNILYGQEFYRKEFGVESTDIFLPDCFGFGWTLPTIASHCGLIGFSSQKLGWRQHPFHKGKKLPFNIGLWKGVDGSKIMMAHGYNYTTQFPYGSLHCNEDIKQRIDESELGVIYQYYGVGDKGGAPTITSVDAMATSVCDNGVYKFISSTSDRLYKDYMPYESHPELPEYEGELLMDVHGNGCYTAQAAMKLYNRQNELLGDAAERISVAAEILGREEYPSQTIADSWKRFIWHQFHDDLTGTSIPKVYNISWNDELISLKQFANTVTDAVDDVSGLLDTRVKGTPVVVYNALGFEATDVVEIGVPCSRKDADISVYDSAGKKMLSQLLSYKDGKARILAQLSVPANGVSVFDLRVGGKRHEDILPRFQDVIENSIYRLKLNEAGDIVSLIDKRNSRELVRKGKAIRLALFSENKSLKWPAWEIQKETIDGEPVSISDGVSIELVEDGNLRKTLRISKRYDNSKFVQYIHLYEGALADRIDFFNEIDWKTSNALLKAEFPLTISDEYNTYDLGLGTIRRGVNRENAYEVPAQYWADLTDKSGDYGFTVINNCKYGWDKPDMHTIRLTLLHSPATEKRYTHQSQADWGHHEFTYSIIGHEGSLRIASARRNAEILNQRMKPFVAYKHPGILGKSFSLAGIDNDNILIKALKKAESSDDYIIRIYEADGRHQDGAITFASEILEAYEADGTEKKIANAVYKGNTLNVEVKANGLKTYKVKLARKEMESKKYSILPLKYNKKCFSWTGFEKDADFHDGYSYAAELVPESIVSDGIRFSLENKELLNGLSCKGDTIRMPDEGVFNRVYLLAAAKSKDSHVSGIVKTGKKSANIIVSPYTGYVGQWGHDGETGGYLYVDDVAWIGTHRHSPAGDHAYEFTYMFRIPIDIPAGTKYFILPNNEDIVIFAATAVSEPVESVKSAIPLFRSAVNESK